MNTTDTTFGHWLMTAAGTGHYFLNGTPLCGAALKGGEKRPDRHTKLGRIGNIDTRYRCPTCHALNLKRWEKP